MRPTIDFHYVAKIDLTPIREFSKTEKDDAFACRDLVLTDKDGEKFEITLFADTAAALRIQTLTEWVHDPLPAATGPTWNEEDAS